MNLNKIMEKDNKCEIGQAITEELQDYFDVIDEIKTLVTEADFTEKQRESICDLVMLLILSSYRNLVEIFREVDCERCHDSVAILDAVYDDLLSRAEGLVKLNLSFNDIYNKLNTECNQVLDPVYVNLTPQMANSQVFKQMCLCPNQPAVINCSKCSMAFMCDRDHISMMAGTLKDQGCTMECLQEQVGKWHHHRSECMANPNKAMMSYRPHSPGICMFCHHSDVGKSCQILTCSNHLGQTNSCLSDRQLHNGVKIVTMNEDRWIDIACLLTIIYRMAIPHSFGECEKKTYG